MHPATSVIAFTSLSGAGYGLLFLIGLGSLLQFSWADSRWVMGVGLFVALALVSIGLLASTQHLRRPERAWRALSQWRSSWLSREGVLALLTFVPAGLLFLTVPLLDGSGWFSLLCALLSLVGAAATVFATAMIYRSLKPIRQWHHPKVVPVYLLLGLGTGACLLTVVLSFHGGVSTMALVGAVVLLAAWAVKWLYWQEIDRDEASASMETATGLGAIGKVRLLEPPHTEENYLLSEMGFRIARKHASKLRHLALGLAAAAVVLLLLTAIVGSGWGAMLIGWAAALLSLGSAALERWLFFAEATHTVTLYYGKAA